MEKFLAGVAAAVLLGMVLVFGAASKEEMIKDDCDAFGKVILNGKTYICRKEEE